MQGEILDGRYELLQRLGRGGMGEVWVARDMRMERQVAVKLLYGRRDEAGSDELRRRFRREVQAAARLPGRHTVTAHDWGEALVEDERRLYMVMELLHGPTLADAVRRRRPDWRTAADWAAQVATALDAAHRQHIVHRDLKPQNVMFAADGDVRLLDFGIAKFVGATDRSGRLTATGAPIGTLHWMSPEQAHGRTDVDHRSDLYALGCLLYFMVTGGPPIVVDHVGALLVRLEEGQVVRPREHVPALPAGLDALIMHLLAVAPGQRPQSAAEVLARLRELSAGGPAPAARTPPRTPRRWRRSPASPRHGSGSRASTPGSPRWMPGSRARRRSTRRRCATRRSAGRSPSGCWPPPAPRAGRSAASPGRRLPRSPPGRRSVPPWPSAAWRTAWPGAGPGRNVRSRPLRRRPAPG
ncbi:serine/threonine-protein kinase [Streptomyces sanyensis]|uniref:serine/threonine-protein kinase n=1 Tax=Streptomyces sanyensis TaxID=568869 RepID=UPI003D774773